MNKLKIKLILIVSFGILIIVFGNGKTKHMSIENAEWWMETITELLGDKKLVIVSQQGYKFDPKVLPNQKLQKITIMSHDEGGYSIMINDYTNIEQLEINADEKTILVSIKNDNNSLGNIQVSFTLQEPHEHNSYMQWHTAMKESKKHH